MDAVGSDAAVLNTDESVMIDVRCLYMLTMQLSASDVVASDNASSSVVIDSVVLIPDYRLSRAYTDAGRCK